jgi:hypothetical protein
MRDQLLRLRNGLAYVPARNRLRGRTVGGMSPGSKGYVARSDVQVGSDGACLVLAKAVVDGFWKTSAPTVLVERRRDGTYAVTLGRHARLGSQTVGRANYIEVSELIVRRPLHLGRRTFTRLELE